eukprot:10429155-Alexandrium_andersonii.AAC.1
MDAHTHVHLPTGASGARGASWGARGRVAPQQAEQSSAPMFRVGHKPATHCVGISNFSCSEAD